MNFHAKLLAALLSSLLTPHSSLLAQCPITVSAGPDQVACAPSGTVTLNGSIGGSFLGFGWTPAAGLSDPSSLTPTATVTGTVTYTLSAQAADPSAANLVTNPGFEAGNTAFTSDYIYNPTPITPGTYVLTTSPALVLATFPPCDDHTYGNGTGNMMLVNGAGAAGANIWCQTIPVTPNTFYVMSAWIIGSPISPAMLQFAVNGTAVGNTYTYSGGICQWNQFSATWNSGSATSANLCIITQNNSGNGFFGDDYALDDIFFAPACTVSDQVTVSLATVNAVLAPTAILPCSLAMAGIVLDGSASTAGPNISYQWTTSGGSIVSGANTHSATVNAPGSYTLTVTYSNGPTVCTDQATIEVFPDPNMVVASAFSPNNLNCLNPTVTLIGGGSSGAGITYSWTPLAGIVAGANTLNPVVNLPNLYTLTVTNAASGCTATASVVVTANFAQPNAAASAPNAITCANATVVLSGTGSSTGAGIGYAWTPAANVVSGGSTLTPTVNAPGAYTLTVTNSGSGCTATATATVSSNTTPPNAAASAPTAITCTSPTVLLSGAGSSTGAGFSYAWSPAANVVSGGSTLAPVINAPGTYTLTVTSAANGCTATATATVVGNNSPPTATVAPPPALLCSPATVQLNGAGSSTGAGFTYAWTPAAGVVSGGSTLTPTVDSAGTYTLTVTNAANGCTATASATVAANLTPPTATAATPPMLDCIATPISLNGGGSSAGAGFSYLWTTAGGNILSGETTLTPSVNAAGVYTLTVTSAANGCTASASATVAQTSSAPVAVIAPASGGQLDCQTASITLDASGSSSGANISFAWTTAGGNFAAGQNTLTPVVDAPGTYTLTVTNTASNCIANASADVVLDTVPPIADAGPPLVLNCYDPTPALDGSGSSQGAEFAYLWTTSDGSILSGETTLTPLVDAAGTYLLTVTDTSNHCAATASTTTTENFTPPVAVAGAPQTITCTAPTPMLDGSASSQGANFTYLWTTQMGGIIGANTLTPTATEAGLHTLTVTDITNGCTDSDATLVSIFADFPDIQIAPPPSLTCTDSTVALSASASGGLPFTYLWTTPNGSIVSGETTLTPTVDAPGAYFLTVTNSFNGCSATEGAVVTYDLASPVAEAGAPFTFTCAFSQTQLDGSGSSAGPGFFRLWTTPDGSISAGWNTLTPTINAPGTYILTIASFANGCVATDTVAIAQDSAAPTADAGAPVVLDCYNPTPSLDGSGSSQGAQFTYLWTTSDGNIASGATTLSPVVDEPGTYLLSVFNTQNNCQTIGSTVAVDFMTFPTAEAGTAADTLDCTTTSLALEGEAFGNSLAYLWTSASGGGILSGGTTLAPVVDKPGTYLLTVTNLDNGCTASDSVLVLQNVSPPLAAAAAPEPFTCIVEEITLDGAGSSTGSNISYLWTQTSPPGGGGIVSGDTTLTPVVDALGTYLLTVTDTNGCTATATVTPAADTLPPLAFAAAPEAFTCLVVEVPLSGAGSSSGAGFSYLWTQTSPPGGGGIVSGDTTLTPVAGTPGTYTLTVTSLQNGCTATASATPPADTLPPLADAGADDSLGCGAAASLPLDGSGSSQGSEFAYLWTTVSGSILSGNGSLTPVVDAVGTYVLTVTDLGNGCTASDSAAVASSAPPAALVALPEMLTCATSQVKLDGSGSSGGANFTYAWTTVSGSILSGSGSLTPLVDSAGTYLLTVTNTATACTATATAEVFQNTSPPGAEAGAGFTLTCNLPQATLAGSSPAAGATFAWTTVSGSILSGSGSSTPVVDSAGAYLLTVTDPANGCTSTDSAVVAAVLLENFSFETADPDCLDNAGSIAFTGVQGGTAPYAFSTDGGASFFPDSLFDNLPPATYELVVQDADGCILENTASLPAPDLLVVTLEPVVQLALGDSWQFDPVLNVPESQVASVAWSPADWLDCTGCLRPTATPPGDAAYSVVVTDLRGCTASASISLVSDRSATVFVPTAFSPNGDGINDRLTLFGKSGAVVKVLSFNVFTRWGESVWRGENFPPNDETYGWDGTHRGKKLDVGVYGWFAEVEYSDGGRDLLEGDVTLVR